MTKRTSIQCTTESCYSRSKNGHEMNRDTSAPFTKVDREQEPKYPGMSKSENVSRGDMLKYEKGLVISIDGFVVTMISLRAGRRLHST